MKLLPPALLCVALSSPWFQSSAGVDPSGTFTVTTSNDTGDLVKGTLTVRRNAEGGYAGEFVSDGLGKVPMIDITSSGTHLLGVFVLDDGKAFVDLEKNPDGALTGTWYRLGDGLPITLVRVR
jgi:hypothetical protein